MKTKILTISSLLIITFSIFASCSKNEEITKKTETTEINVDELIQRKYNLTKSSISLSDINKFNLDNTVYNLKEAYVYSNVNSGEKFLIVPEISNPNNNILLKYTESEGRSLILKELTVQNMLDCEGNGMISITNKTSDISFTSTFVKGKQVDYTPTTSLSKNTSNTRGGLCQREKNESFKACFNRESDDFCDDLIGTLAYYSNMSVPLLIAGLCSC